MLVVVEIFFSTCLWVARKPIGLLVKLCVLPADDGLICPALRLALGSPRAREINAQAPFCGIAGHL